MRVERDKKENRCFRSTLSLYRVNPIMLSPIGVVLSVEALRDGGSLAAIFQCLDSSVYGLLLKIDLFKNSDGGTERRGFLPPVLFDSISGIETAISWSQAQLLLSQILPLIRTNQDRRILAAMAEVIQNTGQLPLTNDKIVGQWNMSVSDER